MQVVLLYLLSCLRVLLCCVVFSRIFQSIVYKVYQSMIITSACIHLFREPDERVSSCILLIILTVVVQYCHHQLILGEIIFSANFQQLCYFLLLILLFYLIYLYWRSRQARLVVLTLQFRVIRKQVFYVFFTEVSFIFSSRRFFQCFVFTKCVLPLL